ncbi:MAG: YesL family protein [Lachnospiraceae bacterium]|nr:YesL family protein [Lachnospiraceae bacterium]
MHRLFDLENPVWRFIGNIIDMFLLSIYWYLCCLPVITAGSGTTALFYVTLKLTSNQEGYTTASFFKSFKSNFKQATLIWLICLLAGVVLFIDFYWALTSGSSIGASLLPAFVMISVIYLIFISFLFPLLARCENTVKAILGMCFVMSIRNFLPILSTLLVTAGIFSVAIFIFWPLIFIAPGLSAYLNSYIYNHILKKYHLDLPNE